MIGEWITGLGIYLGPAIILAVEILGAMALFANGILARHQKQNAASASRGEKLYCDQIAASQTEIHILVRHRERSLVFATKNVTSLLGISENELRSNIICMTGHMGRSESRAFWQNYDKWNQQEILSAEYFDETAKRWFRLSVTPCADSAYDLFVFLDITAERDREKAMQKRLADAESVSESKTTFLSRMSHEIRTPMNGVQGMLTLIEAQPHNEIIGQYLQKAQNLSDYLLSLINDILDMSRIENGKMELEDQPFDLLDIAAELRDMFQKNVEAKGVRFIVETPDLKLHCVRGDRLRLTQILVNFISNAVKFTSEGEVRVTMKEMTHGEEKISLMFRVHDTGEGMDPKFLNRIFRPFEQEDAGVARRHGGSGLGMAITDQMVRLMGGEILIDTMPGRGSDFSVYLTLPLADEKDVIRQTELVLPTENEQYHFTGVRILMAEDNEINAEIAIAILEEMGAEVEIAADGQDVVNRFAQNPPNSFDLILMDIQMPMMDGRDAARVIRAMNRSDAKEIPIFALSADAFVEDQRMSAEAGMNGYFSKPIDFKQLEHEIGIYMLNHGGKKK